MTLLRDFWLRSGTASRDKDTNAVADGDVSIEISSSIYQRPLQIHEILGRRKAADVGLANEADFEVGPVGIKRVMPSDKLYLPYCIDCAKERAVFVDAADSVDLQRAPFFYREQYRQATRMVKVPFERMALAAGTNLAGVTLVLSIGRCGSTLLSGLLGFAGASSLSEPDIYSQIAASRPETSRFFGAVDARHVIRASTEIFAATFGANVFLKMRSQCNGIIDDLVKALPEARFVYMLRERRAWAASRYRVFGDEPRSLAGMLKWGVQAYESLHTLGVKPTLIWYEDLKQSPIESLRRLGVRDRLDDLDADGLANILAADSQQGTPLARQSFQARALSAAQMAAFDEEWTKIAPRPAISRLGLERLLA